MCLHCHIEVPDTEGMQTGKHLPHSISEIQQVHAQARPHMAALSHGRHANRCACAARWQIWNVVEVNTGMPMMPWHGVGRLLMHKPVSLHCLEAAVCPLHHMVALDPTDVQTSRPCSQCLWDWDIACAQTGVPSCHMAALGHSRSADRCALLKPSLLTFLPISLLV